MCVAGENFLECLRRGDGKIGPEAQVDSHTWPLLFHNLQPSIMSEGIEYNVRGDRVVFVRMERSCRGWDSTAAKNLGSILSSANTDKSEGQQMKLF